MSYSVENGMVYKTETGADYEITSAYCSEYRVAEVDSVKSWERFDFEVERYVPAPEYSQPFPEEPQPQPDNEQRIIELEAANVALKFQVASALQAASETSENQQFLLEMLVERGVV